MARSPRKKKQPDTLAEALQPLLKDLAKDLLVRAKDPGPDSALREAHAALKSEARAGGSFDVWRRGRVDQIAAAWVLSLVFVRVLEDRDLLPRRRLVGEDADEARELFFALHPSLSERDWLLTIFTELARLPATKAVFDPDHNPVWRLAPSGDTARKLREFFAAQTPEGALRWSFAAADTRLLGDLYQHLNEDVRETYALHQTPDFVESFLLDQTLEPALDRFDLEEFRLLDPTCGSGHFLLGAFDRLLDRWRAHAPSLSPKDHATRALAGVAGTDLNPYAVAIARFRLTLAWLDAAGVTSLLDAPEIDCPLAVCDSLITASQAQNIFDAPEFDELRTAYPSFTFEQKEEALALLARRYHAVVGNPPYVTVKDATVRDEIRRLYPEACKGLYQLVAPFIHRFFQLAADDGFVAAIVGNGFIKREFGKTVIERVLPSYDLTRIIDTSGAYIPGHGTPTVILVGRHRPPGPDPVPAVLGKRGEPTTPERPEKGKVWTEIATHYDDVGFDGDFVSTETVPRSELTNHPWTLAGGGARELKKALESSTPAILKDQCKEIGFGAITRADPIYFGTEAQLLRHGIRDKHVIQLVEGDKVRDWSLHQPRSAVFPYGEALNPIAERHDRAAIAYLWPYKASLWKRKEPNGDHRKLGLTWFEWSRFQRARFRTPLSITFAFVASHNHFVLDRGGKVFKQSAPVIKLPEDATEDDHFALLAYLNSSLACFWMKMECFAKGGDPMGDGGMTTRWRWEDSYEFAGTPLSRMPILKISQDAIELARCADAIATSRPSASAWLDNKLKTETEPSAEEFLREDKAIRDRLVGYQEELDWHAYAAAGLYDGPLLSAEDVDALDPADRPFERVHSEDIRAQREDDQWFVRHGRPVPIELISSTPQNSRSQLINERIRLVLSDARLRSLEQPDYKRRWPETDVSREMETACDLWIACEAEKELHDPNLSGIRSITRLLVARRNVQHAYKLRHPDGRTAIEAWVSRTIQVQSVPALSEDRFTPSGREKHAAWKHTWELQRREDAGEDIEVPVPPKYATKDFAKPEYYKLRGKLDVPKEAFISYPGFETDAADPLIGWAGWTPLERARALADLYEIRKDEDEWPADRLLPILKALEELILWIDITHPEPDPDTGSPPAQDLQDFLTEERRQLGA